MTKIAIRRFCTGAALCLFATIAVAAQSTRIQANDNRVPGGNLENGVLTLHLELREADWYPEAESGPSMKVYAFGEEGKAPQTPGPLLRVAQGAEVHVTIRNFLSATAIIRGLHRHPGESSDVVEVPPGEMRETTFSAGLPGTYQYWASAGGDMSRGRPYHEDSQLAGAFVVDPPGNVAPDRVFVIANWRSQVAVTKSQDIPVINGKSWPYTERLTYSASEPVRWRWINASDTQHPMHLHGSFYRVDSDGDAEHDHIYEPSQQQMVVTHGLMPGSTMSTFWNPPAGRWLFHCHLVAHFAPEMNMANALMAPAERSHEHGAEHMAGLVMGITVTGTKLPIISHGRVRKLKLLVRERAAGNGLPAGFAFQIEEAHKLYPEALSMPGPALILERNRPVEITVVNQLRESTSVHWHGMELESYYDGVSGWGMQGSKLSPSIAPGGSFRVRFTPQRSGTFIYHTHLNDGFQISHGLYGALLVIDPGARFDPVTDQVFLISRAGTEAERAPLLVNGNPQPATMRWHAGKRYRLRLIDITGNTNGMVTLLGSQGPVQWRAVAKDGADLPASQAVMRESRQPLFVGETYEFEYQPVDPGSLHLDFENLALNQKISQPIEID